MTPEEQGRIQQLCALMQEEEDHEKLVQLVRELNELLERKGGRLEDQAAQRNPNQT